MEKRKPHKVLKKQQQQSLENGQVFLCVCVHKICLFIPVVEGQVKVKKISCWIKEKQAALQRCCSVNTKE